MRDLAHELMEQAPLIAAQVTQRMVEQYPDMFEAFRKRLRNPAKTPEQWCTEDTVHHLQHLSAALETEAGEFERYRVWLTDMLAARGVGSEDIDRNFTAMAWVLRERYGEDAAPAVNILQSETAST